MNKGLFVISFLLGCLISHTAMSETIAYFKKGKLYVIDPAVSSSRIEIDDGTSDFQVGHHVVAFLDKRNKQKLYFASAATGWRKKGVDREVVFYQLTHDALVWLTKNGKLYRITALTSAATTSTIEDRSVTRVLVYDDGTP